MTSMTDVRGSKTAVASAVHSVWTAFPPEADGFLDAGEWAASGGLQMPAGVLHVKNDATTLWLRIDGAPETTPGDYAVFQVAVEKPGTRAAYRDVAFSITTDEMLARGFYLIVAPAACDIGGRVVTASKARLQGAWDLAFRREEIGPGTDSPIRFGMHLRTRGKPFDFPPKKQELERLVEIVPAPRPQPHYAAAGQVIAGIGAISVKEIDTVTGVATVRRADDGLYFVNHAFGGVLDFFANPATLTALLRRGAKEFTVRCRTESSPWSHLVHAPLRSEAEYARDALLFRWSTLQAPDMLHQLEIDFFDAAGAKMSAPFQKIRLRIHNRKPVVEILDVRAHSRSIAPGETVTMASEHDALLVTVRAVDAEGFMEGYQLVARYGENQSIDVLQDFYTWHNGVNPPPDLRWDGTPELTAIWVIPVTATYQCRLNALGRVTDGYRPILYNETWRTIDVVQPYPDHSEHRVSERHIEPLA